MPIPDLNIHDSLGRLSKEITSLIRSIEIPPENYCQWDYDPRFEGWRTECRGQWWSSRRLDPELEPNKVRFCPTCGRKIVPRGYPSEPSRAPSTEAPTDET